MAQKSFPVQKSANPNLASFWSKSCIICKCDLFSEDEIADEDVSALKCGHVFHYACLMKWVDVHPECPKCRSEIQNPSEVVKKLYFDSEGEYFYDARDPDQSKEVKDQRRLPSDCCDAPNSNQCQSSSSSHGPFINPAERQSRARGSQSEYGGRQQNCDTGPDWCSSATIAVVAGVAGIAAGALLGGLAKSMFSRKRNN